MPTIIKAGATFNNLAPYHGLFLFNEAIGDDGAGEEMPSPLTWNTTSPVGDVDWSAFTVAVDAAGINRSNRAGATLVSPNYCVHATHAPGDNTGHTWMTPAGVEVTRTLGSTPNVDYWTFPGSDLSLAKLSAPINNITPMPLLVNCAVVAGRPCLVLEMDRHLNVYQCPEDLVNATDPINVTQDPGTDEIESGDSGKPVTILIDGTPVMVSPAMYASDVIGTTYIGICHNASHYISEINAILDGDGEELTLWDLRYSTSGGVASSPATTVSFSPLNTPILLGN